MSAVAATPDEALRPGDFLVLDERLDDTERDIRDVVAKFGRERIAPQIEDWYERGHFPRELAGELGALGLLGMHLTGHGCAGANATAYGIACRELEAIDSGLRSFVSVQGSLAMFPICGQLVEEGFETDRITLRRSIDMRYRRQVHILTVPVQGDGRVGEEVLERTIARFEELYEEKYGKESAYREAGVELVSFRIRGTGSVRKPRFRVHDLGDPDPSEAVAERISIWVDKAGEMREVNGYDFERMTPGHRIEGPAVIWTPITTLVVAPGQTARVDEYKNVVLATDVVGEGTRSRPEHAEIGA
jgi:Hydantoinase/oxoprolinase C-terminal domain/Acyl-CoA dehydrogenase, N-terminal domain